MTTNGADRLRCALAAIDAANARDPRTVEVDGERVPVELLYGQRMAAALDRFVPDASEALVIAARGQHIERWTSPRATYPEGRAGYLEWRRGLPSFHARRLAEILSEQGFEQATIERVGALVRKERMKQDADAQTLEDVVCIVFLTHYVEDFATKHDDDKLGEILARTWHKMSDRGREDAVRLSLSPRVLATLQLGLARVQTRPQTRRLRA